MKKILTLDGGGMAGLMSCIMLAEIEHRTGKPLSETFDMIAGTSTGAIVALGLACPAQYTAQQLVGFYEYEGPRIFKRSFWHYFGLLDQKYPHDILEEVLKQYFGTTVKDYRSINSPPPREFKEKYLAMMLSDTKTEVLVPTYNITTGRPQVFKTHTTDNHENDIALWRLARAASAAPTFFEPYCSGDGALVDGGVVANNPAMCAYAEARRLWGPEEELVMVSVGTGEKTVEVACDTARGWGLLGWARQLAPVFLDGGVNIADYQLQWMDTRRGMQYYRLQPEPHPDYPLGSMDDASEENIQNLKTAANIYIQKNMQLLNLVEGALK